MMGAKVWSNLIAYKDATNLFQIYYYLSECENGI